MKVAILTSDGREVARKYELKEPMIATAPSGLLYGFHGINDINVHIVCCNQQPVESPEKLAENIWFHSLHVPKWGWLKTGYSGCIRAIRKKLAEIQPDIVHAQGTEREAAISAVFCNYPRVLTIHGNLRLIKKVLHPKPWQALALQAAVEGYAVPKFDGIVCITNYTKQAIEHETPKTWVISNAVDQEFLALGEERERQWDGSVKVGKWEGQEPSPDEITSAPSNLSPSHFPTILVVANVDARKNQNAFIQALDPLVEKQPFRIKFFGKNGGGDYGNEFDRLVRERDWCEFGGMIGRKALQEEFRNAFAVALPTHEDNCPMVVLEAQAAGLPVMASNVGGVPDLVEDGVTGLLTDPHNPESMRQAIGDLLTKPDLVKKLIQNGRRQAIEKFHPKVIAEKHLAVYREVLESRKL